MFLVDSKLFILGKISPLINDALFCLRVIKFSAGRNCSTHSNGASPSNWT
jgi:hypothetical protein